MERSPDPQASQLQKLLFRAVGSHLPGRRAVCWIVSLDSVASRVGPLSRVRAACGLVEGTRLRRSVGGRRCVWRMRCVLGVPASEGAVGNPSVPAQWHPRPPLGSRFQLCRLHTISAQLPKHQAWSVTSGRREGLCSLPSPPPAPTVFVPGQADLAQWSISPEGGGAVAEVLVFSSSRGVSRSWGRGQGPRVLSPPPKLFPQARDVLNAISS